MATSLDPTEGRIHGIVSDGSGGVLPGVTVVATAGDGRILETETTDGAGAYVFAPLPDGPVTLIFQLEGFTPAIVELAVKPDADLSVSQRLMLAARAEAVIVYGKAAVDLPAPRRSPPPPPSPPPLPIIPVPPHDRDSICGPAKPGEPATFGTIRSRRHEEEDGLYSKGDELVIDGGTLNGIEVGRNFVVRRTYRVSGSPDAAVREHTAGVVQIVSAEARRSVAAIIYACDELLRGDRLAVFEPEPLRAPEPAGIPDFDNAAKVLFADVGQTLGVQRRMMVIDLGSNDGIQVGQRVTLFRRQGLGGGQSSVIGDAVVVAVRIDSATIRVDRASDVIEYGDWAAPQH